MFEDLHRNSTQQWVMCEDLHRNGTQQWVMLEDLHRNGTQLLQVDLVLVRV